MKGYTMENENITILDDGEDLTQKAAAEFVETIEAQAEQAKEAAAPVASVITPDEFEKHFFEIFDICGDLWGMPEFKVQRDKPFEVAGAKVSAAKLYNMAQKYKMLHFLIEPCGGWFGDTIAIACFAGAKANILCKKYTGNGLTGYLKKFVKKSGEQVKENSFFSRFFKKSEVKNGKEKD